MINMQQFDIGDCPYQINQFLEKYDIKQSEIVGWSHSDKTIIMSYNDK